MVGSLMEQLHCVADLLEGRVELAERLQRVAQAVPHKSLSLTIAQRFDQRQRALSLTPRFLQFASLPEKNAEVRPGTGLGICVADAVRQVHSVAEPCDGFGDATVDPGSGAKIVERVDFTALVGQLD